MVQWLGFGTFIAVVWVQSLVGELRSHKLRDVAKKYIIYIHIYIQGLSLIHTFCVCLYYVNAFTI